MNENRDLRSRLVVGQKRDGRREFDEDAVRELVALCLKPGVSIARAAMDHDVNPNQLRRWIARYQPQILHDSREPDPVVIDGVSIDIAARTVRSPCSASTLPAFVPVISAPVPPSTPSTPVPSMTLALHVRLPNGVELNFRRGWRRRDHDDRPGAWEAAVFRFDEGLNVYLHRDPVDFRFGMNSLSILVEQAMGLNPMDSSLYVFTNRRCHRIKILGWDHNGFWLLFKRLEEKDRFVWPDSSTEVVTLDVERLQWLLKGADIAALRRHPKRHYARVS